MGTSRPESFQQIQSFFGGSIFPEEYRGNFIEAKNRIDVIAQAVDDNDQDGQALVLLLNALYLMLIGNLRSAGDALNSLFSSNFERRWHLRAISYRILLTTVTQYSYFFSSSPPDKGYQTALWTSESGDPTQYVIQKLMPEAQQLFVVATALDRSEYQYLFAIFFTKLRQKINRNQLRGHHLPKVSPDELRNIAAPTVRMLQDMAPTLQSPGETGLRHFFTFNINNVWYSYHIEDNSDSDRLYSLHQAYLEARDDIGVAMCKMIEGDSYASPFFTHITLLNLIVVEGVGAGVENLKWDIVEGNVKVTDVERAEMCYNESLEKFSTAHCDRGKAAIHLRRACIRHILSINEQDQDKRLGLLNEAKKFLCTAECLFELCGDVVSIKFVKIHHVLIDICLENVENVNEKMRSIGKWGLSTENIYFAHFLGLLLLRYGHRQVLQNSNFDIARACFQAAYCLFEELNAIVSSFQAKITDAILLKDMGDYERAQDVHNEAEAIYTCIRATLDQNGQRLEVLRKQIEFGWPLSLFTQLYQIYYYVGDFERLQQMIHRIIEGPEDSEDVRFFKCYFEQWLLWNKTKMKYRNKVWAGDLATGRMILENGISQICSLPGTKIIDGSTSKFDQALMVSNEIAHINLLIQLQRFSEATARLQSLDESNFLGANSKISPFPVGMYMREAIELQSARVGFNLCVLARDFKRAEKFYAQVEELDPLYFHAGGGHKAGRHWDALFLAGLMREGLGERDKALQLFQAGTYLAECHREDIRDPTVRLTSFDQDDIGNMFITAARVCLYFHLLNPPYTHPQKFECKPRLKGRSWAEQAFLFLEQGKARSLLDSIFRRPDVRDKVLKKLLNDWNEQRHTDLVTEYSSSETKFSNDTIDDRMRVATLQHQIQQHAKLSKSLFEMGEPNPIDYLIIPSDTAVIELGLTDYSLVVICITSCGIDRAVKVDITGSEVQEQVALVHKNMVPGMRRAKNARHIVSTAIKTLSEAIIEPVSDSILNKSNLVFVPSSSLARFPFGMLKLHGDFLLLNYTISISPSLLTFLQLRRRHISLSSSKPLRASVMCNPDEVEQPLGKPLPAIPFVGFESMYVAKILGSSPKLSSEVDEAQFKAMVTECDILHLAAHGSLNTKQPLLSTIHLESAFKVMDLSKTACNASLVVFSACVSGLGRITYGEDLLGFSHAVLGSGAQAFIGTLWSVDDLATMLFMMMFYKALKGNGSVAPISVVRALQTAQIGLFKMNVTERNVLIEELLSMLDEVETSPFYDVIMKYKSKLDKTLKDVFWNCTDPYFWAPFILTGYGLENFI